MKPWQLCAAACLVACAWLTDAGAKRSVAAVKFSTPIGKPAVAQDSPKDQARYQTVAYHPNEPVSLIGPPAPLRRDLKSEMSAADILRIDHVADARAYLIRTAFPGGTMTLQGPDLSIGRLQPQFAIRLAGAIREARANGLPKAAVFSAYRPPVFGIGGFKDKFLSMHAYGLAVDMAGVGRPGSKEAIKFWQIAGRWKIVNPYGPWHRAEWNHFQAAPLKLVAKKHPLRPTISKSGPRVLETMWKVAEPILQAKVFIPKSVKPPTRYAKKIHKTRYAKHHKRRYASAS